MTSQPTASIVIPTRGRPDYLAVTLASIADQAQAAGAEMLVLDDSGDRVTSEVALARGARVLNVPPPGGANAARNAGVLAARGDLIVLVDDDVRAPSGWLEAILDGASRNPEHEVFGGPIRACLEGGGPRSCGREDAPITTLDRGSRDCDVELVWSANMAIRASALQRVGQFDETLRGRGEEEDWQRRYVDRGGRIRYLAAAGLVHRRTPPDASVKRLGRAAYGLGRTSRRYDIRKGATPSLAAELRTLLGCIWHVFRRRCAIGIVLAAHAAGRLREALAGPVR